MNRNQIYFVLENENHKTASLPDSNIKKKVLIDVTRWWGSFMKDQKMLAWMLIFILSLLGVTFPPPPLCDALIKMVTLLLLVYVPLSFSWFLSLSLSSLSLSLQECWVALCPSHLETALPSLLMSLHFGRRGEKAREPFPLLQLTAVPSRSPLLIPTWDCTRGLE